MLESLAAGLLVELVAAVVLVVALAFAVGVLVGRRM